MLFREILFCYFFMATVHTFAITLMDTKESTARLKPVLWRQTNQLNLRVLSNGDDGTIFTVTNKYQNKLMRLEIHNGRYRLQFDNQNRELPGLTDQHISTEHWTSIQIKQGRNSLIITIDQMKSVLLLIRRRHWSMENWKHVTLGVLSRSNAVSYSKSMVGCIELFNNNSVILDDYAEKVHAINTVCIDACRIQSCENNGRCVNKFNHGVCDCQGTGYDGPTCENKARAVYVNEQSFIKFRKDIPETRNHVFSIRFKTSHQSGLLYTQSTGSSLLIVELINGTLYVNSTTQVEFRITIGERLHDNTWHHLKVKVKPEQIETRLDNQVDITAVYESNNRIEGFFKGQVVTGTVGGTSEISLQAQTISQHNYIGCIQQVYFDVHDVINRLLDKKSSVYTSVGELQSCEDLT